MPIPAIEPRRTLNGLFDAYCHVCWNPVYRLWVSDEDPAGRCIFGLDDARKCPDAMAAARNAAAIKRAMKEAADSR